MTQVRVRKFDVGTIKPDRIMLAVGKRGSGKSKLLEDLLYNLRDRFDYVLGMCPTMESSVMLRRCMPGACVYNRFSPAKLELLVQTAGELAAKGKERHFLVVLDDVLYDKTVLRSKAFRYLFFNGRHSKIALCVLCQYLVDMPPDLRANVDYIFSMKETVLANRMKLYKMFFGVFYSFQDFEACFERCTQNFECICMDNTLQSSSPSDCIFWYKANINLPDFKLGSKVFYDLEDQYRRAEGSAPAPPDDAEPAKKKASIAVLKEGEDDPDSGEEVR